MNDNCDYRIYDIVKLNSSNLSISWKNNHKYFNVLNNKIIITIRNERIILFMEWYRD